MAAVGPKSADELRREIEELNRQQREITERLRDPRGLRKAGAAGAGPRGAGVGLQRPLGRGLGQRGIVRRGDAINAEEQPPAKKRLLSAVVKVEGDDENGANEENAETDEQQEGTDVEKVEEQQEPRKPYLERGYGRGRREFRGADRGVPEQENETLEPLPRVMPQVDDPSVAKRNRRMFGALLGTLEKFRQEDKKLSGTEAFMRRSTSQKRAEQRAQEESERLRQQEREQLAGKRKRDMILRARLAAKAEEKQLEVLFIQWTEHQTKLCSFLRTKAEPGIFWMPAKPSEETDKLLETRKEDLGEWKTERRAELTEYQRTATEEHLAKVEVDIARWQAGPQQGSGNDVPGNTEQEADDPDATGNGEKDSGKHGWRRGRDSKESERGEDDQGDDGDEDEAKMDTEAEAKDVSFEVELKESDKAKNADENAAGGALKEVMDYGSGDEDMDER
ncbi:unnamed protein product [Calypogeia fissa]